MSYDSIANNSVPIAKHDITVHRRSHADITGITEVISFDTEEIEAVTDCGGIIVEGEGLHIGALDTEKGIMNVDGKISAIYYSDGTVQNKKNKNR